MKEIKLIGPFKQVLPMTGVPLKGALYDEQLLIINDAGIVINDTKIEAIGTFKDLVNQYKNAEIYELKGNHVCLPGFVDAHTHICFAGSRANEYAMRNAGKSYLEIAEVGGGIWDTVTQTRNTSKEDLARGTAKRANRHLKTGVTTIEVKSGYGLSVEEELKMLYAIKEAGNQTPVDLIPTCLAAHMLPRDYNGNAEAYLAEMSASLFPRLIEGKLTNRIDAFIEQSTFTPEQIKPYFKKANELGFDITVHADQFSTGGSETAVDFDAISADHLEASTAKEIKLLANSNVIAIALPGASLGLGCAYTPARNLLDAGASLAIASDHNPGSAPMGDLLTQAAILGAFEKLTNAEVLAGITFRAAAALKLKDRGVLKTGHLADFSLFHTDNYQEILYNQGNLKPCMVWKNGILAYNKHKA
ncbi:imidazolonepropionase [Maribacter sp. CXY002]|uniref:imidazolonepropionase n=1 Tax=Maribacter luteocoastalis TaxID=3407671 RepID=UPI003B670595